MTSIYRTTHGMQAVRSWCEARLSEWGHPHLARLVPTTSGPIHVVTAGSGPDLVLLPGTNFAAATWLDLIGSLASHHTVHAIDLPGQPGLSTAERPIRADRFHSPWLTEALAALGTQRPVLMAHSLGAVPALQAAAAGLPTRRLVLVDPAGLMRLTVSMQVMRPTVPWLRRPNAASSEALLTMMMAHGHRPDPELVDWMSLVGQHVRTSLAPSPVPDRILRALGHTSVDVISGEDDPFLPPGRLRRAVHRRLPGARLEIVASAGHLLPHERPEALRALLGNSEDQGDPDQPHAGEVGDGQGGRRPPPS